MTTRVLTISIEEQADGRKRTVGRKFPADGFSQMPTATAGEGLLTILSQLEDELNGAPKAEPAPPTPEPPPSEPEPKFRKPDLDRKLHRTVQPGLKKEGVAKA